MPFPGPVSKANSAPSRPTRVMLATPPMFSTAAGAASPVALARAAW